MDSDRFQLQCQWLSAERTFSSCTSGCVEPDGYGTRKIVSALLGVDVVGCDRAFYWWPFFATAVILVGATLYSLTGNVTPVLGMIPDWRWRLTPLLAFLLFFHILYLERHRFFVHALIGSGLLATLWLAGSSDWRLTPDLALLCNGLFWAAVAAMLSRPIGGDACAARVF